MADPVSIVGLISSVITFIDFGLKVISESKKLRDSASKGTSDEISELDHYITNIQQWHEQVKQQQLSGLQLSQSEKRILEMVQDCEKLVIELREVIESLKIQVRARSKTIETARVAFQRRWKHGDIQNMRTRLHNLDEQIRSHVERIMQADSRSAIMGRLKELEASQDAENVRHVSHMTQIRDDILNLSEKTPRDLQKWESTQAARLTALGLKFDVLLKEQTSCTYQLEVLRSLHFREIRKRWYGIKTADQMSNEWIYDSRRASFTSWLESDAPNDGIFYITGKAGSGKSTLMKFITKDSRTSQNLNKWAHQCTLHQVSYYFWNQGTEMQKSINGLFQSLLYQILRASPDLIQSVCERRLHHEPWTKEELYETFRRTEKETRLTAKFCFFIDGLDEYEGDEGDITQLLETLSISGRIKICASSRPGRQYEHFLRRRPDRMLDIVRFTQSDMHQHIDVSLQRTTKWKDLERRYPDSCKKIVDTVSARANGVWLWVFLVTNDMVKEVNKNEEIDTLHEIVARFPDDLHEYFETMIMRVPKLHRPDMARILLIAVEEVQPLPLYAFALLEKEKKTVDYVLEAPVEPIRKHETEQEYVALKDRLRNRCSDLLVVDDDQHPVFLKHSVDFLHRTVRDFLRDYDLKAHLTTDSFQPLVSLSRICLGLLKAVPVGNFREPSTVNIIIALTDELLYYAREAEIPCNADQYTPMIPILDEVEKVNCHHARGVRNHWTHARDSPKPRGLDKYKEGGKCNFLALAVQSQLVEYVRAKLQTSPERSHKPGRPLLDYALRPRRVTPIGMPYHQIRDDPSICVDMVEMLLSPAGKADPNQQLPLYEYRSVWTLFLISIAETQKRNLTSGDPTNASLITAWYVVCQKLIEAGARWDGVKAAEAAFNPSKLSASSSILEYIFGYDQASKLTQNVLELEAKMQRSKCNIM